MSEIKPIGETPVSGSMGFAHWLGLLLIGLKLSGNLQWDWFYVLVPLWLLLARWFIEIFARALASTLADMKKEGKL